MGLFLADAGIRGSVGTVGDPCDSSLPESTTELYKNRALPQQREELELIAAGAARRRPMIARDNRSARTQQLATPRRSARKASAVNK